MLGPDVELLTEILLELGHRHVRYGVKPEYFPSLGKVLIDILSEAIDPKIFTLRSFAKNAEKLVFVEVASGP
jgi:hemoglobin-like flavoprotein